MKKFTTALVTTLIAASTVLGTAHAATLNMTVNSKNVDFQYGAPFIDSGSSLVPLRDLLVSLGVANDDEHIRWNASEQSVTIVKDGSTVKLSVGSNQIFLNGSLFKQLEVPAKNVDGRVYLPARAVAESLGFFVGYDADTSTILVQEVPFGGGVKADEYDNAPIVTSTGTAALDLLKRVLSSYGMSLPQASEATISENADAFFGAANDPLSLDSVAKATAPENIVKNVSSYHSSIVNLTFLELDAIRQITLDNGMVVTGAVGHTGGKISPITNTLTEDSYFQIFFVGNMAATKGDKVTVNGIPVAETTIELTNALGKSFVEPMVVLVAGNMLKSCDEYDLRSARSKSDSQSIAFPELEANWKKKIEAAQINLAGDKLTIIDRPSTISGMNGLNISIKSIQIEDVSYTPSEPIEVPVKRDGISIDLKNFVDKNGNIFAPVVGKSYFVYIKTDRGDTISRFVEYQKNE